MKKSFPAFFTAVAAVLIIVVASCQTSKEQPAFRDYPVKPVAFTEVSLTDDFWAPRLETNRIKSIPYAFRMNEETGRVDNFRKAAGLMPGKHKGRRFNDSDIFKSMEAAAYSLAMTQDPELGKKMDELIEIIGQAQEADGYLYTARTIDPADPAPGAGDERWSNLRASHELYNVGHMYEAAIAYHLATGKRTFLDIALKNADFLLATFGPGRRRGFPGHQEIEIGLAKLYRLTGKKEYLDLARFFLDERGYYHQGIQYSQDDPFAIYNPEEYLQNHKPVLEQNEAVGHAVRAMYMFSGMADVAALGGYPEYIAAIDRLWDDVAGRKMYLTGSVGARSGSESFGEAYELPNATAYAETCASIGNAIWNHRLFLLHADAKYMDVFERILYNGLLAGVSLSGDRFFYQNPLESAGDYERSPWFEVACCPPNLTRFMPSLPGYMYGVGDDTIFVNLFIGSEARIGLGENQVVVKQETDYPWQGKVRLEIRPAKPGRFTVAVRIPGWSRGQAVPGDLYRFLDRAEENPSIKVNGAGQPLKLEAGYVFLTRRWHEGDVIELDLPMPVRKVSAHEKVEADRGRLALQRGPIVYCVEGWDNRGRALGIVVPDESVFESRFESGLLGGVMAITGKAGTVLTAIPYYSWANRGKSEMAVWLARTPEAVKSPESVDRDVN